MSEIKFAPAVKPFVPTPTMVDKMIKRADKIAEAKFHRDSDLRWLKMDLSEIARQRREGLVSKAQAKHLRAEAIAEYVGKGYKVVVINGAITFA